MSSEGFGVCGHGHSNDTTHRFQIATSSKYNVSARIMYVHVALEDILVLRETDRGRDGERRTGIGVCDAEVDLSTTPDVDYFHSSRCLGQEYL